MFLAGSRCFFPKIIVTLTTSYIQPTPDPLPSSSPNRSRIATNFLLVSNLEVLKPTIASITSPLVANNLVVNINFAFHQHQLLALSTKSSSQKLKMFDSTNPVKRSPQSCGPWNIGSFFFEKNEVFLHGKRLRFEVVELNGWNWSDWWN